MSTNKREPVILNVYDMLWTNKYTSPIGLGVYHSGIEVFGIEYAFGGHRLPVTGIFEITPCDDGELGEQFRYKQSVKIGHTDCSPQEMQFIIDDLGYHFRGDRYHLLHCNCNHFSQQLAEILCGNSIPNWVNRLAHLISNMPLLQKMLPRDWLTPIDVDEPDQFESIIRNNATNNENEHSKHKHRHENEHEHEPIRITNPQSK